VSPAIAWRVQSLTFPATRDRASIERLLDYEAVQLLLERIRQVEPEFSLTSANADAVAHICTRSDGVPLALELAAARAGGMAIREIDARL
jgi:predicted ATPase